jgi:hypothetical protein
MPGRALEEVMLKTLGMALLATTIFASAAKAAAPICLNTYDMIETLPQKGGASIIFKMRDGSVWRNDLHGRCPDLWFDYGFTWTVRNGDNTVCENENTLRVLKSGEVCALGKFTQLTPARGQEHSER